MCKCVCVRACVHVCVRVNGSGQVVLTDSLFKAIHLTLKESWTAGKTSPCLNVLLLNVS